jgi:anti-sigma factor RsiW
MSCGRLSQVHRYYDGELPAGQRADVEAHIRECAECRELLAGLGRLSCVIAQAGMRPLSGERLERLQHSWRTARERSVIRLAGWLTAAAAVLIAVLLAEPGGRRVELAGQPAFWETVAATPPTEGQEDSGSDMAVMAQWMTDELSTARL